MESLQVLEQRLVVLLKRSVLVGLTVSAGCMQTGTRGGDQMSFGFNPEEWFPVVYKVDDAAVHTHLPQPPAHAAHTEGSKLDGTELVWDTKAEQWPTGEVRQIAYFGIGKTRGREWPDLALSYEIIKFREDLPAGWDLRDFEKAMAEPGVRDAPAPWEESYDIVEVESIGVQRWVHMSTGMSPYARSRVIRAEEAYILRISPKYAFAVAILADLDKSNSNPGWLDRNRRLLRQVVEHTEFGGLIMLGPAIP
jgi:hypothetical protein